MDVREFDFDLPPDLIAQEPAAEATGARLLQLSRTTGATAHHTIADLPILLRDGDVLVVNDTRVFAARLLGRRMPSGGAVECLLMRAETADEASAPASLEMRNPEEYWEALVHPGQKLKPGARVVFDDGRVALHAEILERRFFGRRRIRLWTDDGTAVSDAIDAIGHVPLPPYIKRDDSRADVERYQTMFARHRGAVAAPTAGLHFTADLLAALQARGIEIAAVTLHVGYGTFQPVRAQRVEDHRVEAERFAVSREAAEAINRALDERRRVVAVGTTTTRVLETLGGRHDGRVVPGDGTTSLFIYPGFAFRIVGGLLTNFHLPQSSLLMLVSAFAGRGPTLAAYRAAVAARYRFYSYGDAMLVQ